MRIWELKLIVSRVLDDDNKIFINAETLYGGQAYRIDNFSDLINALELISNQEWSRNFADYESIKDIVELHGIKSPSVVVSTDDYNKINSYVSSLQRYIPIFYSILESSVEVQDEHVINIKLPEKKLSSLSWLSEFNKRLDKNLARFNIDWEFELIGFDVWSKWYVVVATGVITYRVFLACLSISQEYFNTREAYFKSKGAELDYRASLEQENDDKIDKAAFEKFKERRMELEIAEKVNEALENMKIDNGKSQIELKTQLVIATTELIKEIWTGTEFHLSLNPPQYVQENEGTLRIDYKSIPTLDKKIEEVKALESSKEDTKEG